MILRLGALHRRLPLLGWALAVAALGCLREQHRYRSFLQIVDNTDLAYCLFYLGTVALGIHAAWRPRPLLEPGAARRGAGAYLAVLAGLELLDASVFERYRERGWSMSFATDLLVTSVPPFLWGCALVRCQDSTDPRSRKLGRRFALLLAIVLSLMVLGVFQKRGFAGSLAYFLWYLDPGHLSRGSLRGLPTVFLVKGILEELLPVRSPLQAGRRARSVTWALLGWFLCHAGWWAYGVLFSMFRYQSFGNLFWRGLLEHVLLLLIAVSTFLALSKPEPEAATSTESA